MKRTLLFLLEAASGFEPENSGFADRCLTTWLCRQKKMERETGFEPATSTLARSHSTTELFPLNSNLSFNYLLSFCQQKSLILEKSSELKKIIGTGPDSKAKSTP